MARAWVDVDLRAIERNVQTLGEIAAPAAVCAVVKADGYGHGAGAVGEAALRGGATMLAVAQVPEAVALRDAGIDAPVLLLSEPRFDEVDDAVASGVAMTLYTDAAIERVEAVAARADRVVDVHLKIDTGMRRVGAEPGDAVTLARAIDSSPHLGLAGVCTHCPVADEPESSFTTTQLDRFDGVLAALAAAGIDPGVRHAANSAAAIAHPRSRYDLVRCGIAIYGIPPAPALAEAAPLVPALRFTSEVSFVKRVRAGEGVSYGLRHRFDRDTVVATVPVGYADGVWRRLGLVGQSVLVCGDRRPIVGVVTMDQLMIDCGPGATVAIGDEVVLLGSQGDARIDPYEWAAHLDTIAYEVVCAIGPRVERRYQR